jgi:thiamine-phosphate pyrophosphorylase
MNNRQPEKPWLYLVTDRKACEPRDLIDLIEEAAQAGVHLIQIREPDLSARAVGQLVERAVDVVKPYGTRLLVNDRFDIALACGASGVHLTTQSLPPEVVRKHVGHRLIIGVSTHSLEEIRQAEAGSADFVVYGPVFDTPSKRIYGPPLGVDALSEIVRQARIPILGIGGIDLTNVQQVLACGAAGVAAIRLFIESPSISDVVRQVKGHHRRG